MLEKRFKIVAIGHVGIGSETSFTDLILGAVRVEFARAGRVLAVCSLVLGVCWWCARRAGCVRLTHTCDLFPTEQYPPMKKHFCSRVNVAEEV